MTHAYAAYNLSSSLFKILRPKGEQSSHTKVHKKHVTTEKLRMTASASRNFSARAGETIASVELYAATESTFNERSINLQYAH